MNPTTIYLAVMLVASVIALLWATREPREPGPNDREVSKQWLNDYTQRLGSGWHGQH